MARFYGANSKPYGGRHLGGGVFGGGGGDFTPLSIAGLVAWFDASQITGKNDADAISQWNDLSGNGFHATQATGTRQPLYQTNELNGLPGVEFDGSNDVLNSTYDNTDQSISWFVLGRFLVGAADVARMWSIGVDEAGIIKTGSQWGYYNAGGIQGLGGTLTNATLFSLVYASASSLTVYRDGTSVGTWNPSDHYFGASAGHGQLSLGDQDATGGRAAKCQIFEAFAYDSALGDADRDALEAYLGTKWGVTVA